MADQPSPRRRFQFRLRTLLIVVTLLAVACWMVMDRQRLIGERDEAVQKRQEAEGREVQHAREMANFSLILRKAQLESARAKSPPATKP